MAEVERRIIEMKEAHRSLAPRHLGRRPQRSPAGGRFNYETDVEERSRQLRDPDDEDLRWGMARDEHRRRHGERRWEEIE